MVSCKGLATHSHSVTPGVPQERLQIHHPEVPQDPFMLIGSKGDYSAWTPCHSPFFFPPYVFLSMKFEACEAPDAKAQAKLNYNLSHYQHFQNALA